MAAISPSFNMPYIGGGVKLVHGDFNGDGKADIFVINYDWPTGTIPSTYAVLLGQGDGTYSLSQNVTTSDYSFPGKPIVGDFNRDGKDDIFIGTYGNENLQTGAPDRILMGDASGKLIEYRGLDAIRTWAHGSSIGDINNDGLLDILNAGIGPLPSSVWLNSGTGGFTLSSSALPGLYPYFAASNVWSTLIEDLNGDGYSDIVIGHSGGEYALQPWGWSGTGAPAKVFYGSADGSWTPAALPTGMFGAVNTDTVAIAHGDFDGDGRIDLALANYDKGAFLVDGRVVYTGDANAGGTAGTFTVNGYTLTSAGMDNREIQLLLNKESGWVDASSRIAAGAEPTLKALSTIQAIDLDGDGDLDLAGTVATQLTGEKTGPFIWLNDGKGYYTPLSTLGFDASMAKDVWDWAFTDVTGAGDWRMYTVSAQNAYPKQELFVSGALLPKVGIGGSSGNDAIKSSTPVSVPVYAHGGHDTLSFVSLGARAELGAGDDKISAGTDDAVIIGGAGDDTIDGGAGTDTARYAGTRAAFDVVQLQAGYRVADRTGVEGSDTLTNIEKIVFADGVVDLRITVPSADFAHLNGVAAGAPVMSGTAPAGATVRIFQGDSVAGSVQANGDGQWSFRPTASGGAFALHAEAVDASGATSFRGHLVDFRSGTSGGDTLAGAGGREIIDGGGGLDTFTLQGARSAFAVARAAEGFTITGNTANDVHLLVNVERVRFGDLAVAFDTDGVAGQAYRVYQAAFARTPDAAGLGYWIAMMDQGVSLAAVAGGFAASNEFVTAYGANPTNRAIVEKFYQNVLHRDGEKAGIDWWTSLLDNHSITLAEALVGFSESPENKVALAGITGNGIDYAPFG
ncbi:MAG TPA: FG-GAP-like repeat-containing protein [Telluria sp.]|nr:FG-GAP-like repeat-containing protein [Telluria sp.]